MNAVEGGIPGDREPRGTWTRKTFLTGVDLGLLTAPGYADFAVLFNFTRILETPAYDT